MLKNNKALSPLVAVILLIMVATVAALTLYSWQKSQQSVEFERISGAVHEIGEAARLSELAIEGITTENGEDYYLTITNLGVKKLTGIKVYINNKLEAELETLEPKASVSIKLPSFNSENVEIGKEYKVVVKSLEGISASRIFVTKVENYAYLSNWYREDLKFRVPVKIKKPEGKEAKVAVIELSFPEDIDKSSIFVTDNENKIIGFDIVWQGNNATIVFSPNFGEEDEKIFYVYYSRKTNKNIAHENATYKIKILSVYPCGCLLDDIVSSLNMQDKFEVTCLPRDGTNGFNAGNYDLSKYDVVFLDGADCWGAYKPGGPYYLDVEERLALKQFVAEGGGLVFTHDTIGLVYDWWKELEEVAGIVYDANVGCCPDVVPPVKIREGLLTIYPYMLKNELNTQHTHVTRNRVTTATTWYVDKQNPDPETRWYLATHEFVNGKAAYIQWGHQAYKCDCGFWAGIPPDDEKRAIINTIFYVARKYDYEVLKTQNILPIFE